MNALFGTQYLWQLAGWTMLHYFWIGAALGLGTLAARRACRQLPAQLRYGIAVMCFVLLAAAPLAIAAYLSQTDDGAVVEQTAVQSGKHLTPITLPREFAELAIAPALPSESGTSQTISGRNEAAPLLTERFEQVLEPLAGWLPWIWLLGTPLCLLVVASGLYGAERMRAGAILVIDGPVAEALRCSQAALAVGRAVAVAVSDRVVSPLVLGIVKPLILLPAAAVAGWSPEQLQMILLHELSHVRRWDNLVNLVQRVVEAALFYQPAVWLVSNWVRLEREHCCDAVVLAQGNEPQDYAETLASLAMPGISPRYAAAALASHQLVSRIRHILNVEDRSMKVSRRALLTLVCGAVLFSGLVAVYANQQGDEVPQTTTEMINQINPDGVAPEKTTANSPEAQRELKLIESNRDRLLAAHRQVQNLAKSYIRGQVTLDFYLDALYREANATESYTRSLEALWARIADGKKVDPESQQLLKSLVVLDATPDSREESKSSSATPQLAQERNPVRIDGETGKKAVAAGDLAAELSAALAHWRAQLAEAERQQTEAGALHKKATDAGDSVSPELKEAYHLARSEADTAASDEARARNRYFYLRRTIEKQDQSVAKTDRSAEKRPKTAAGALAEWKLRESGAYDAAAVADARERYYYLRAEEENRRGDPKLAWSAAQLIGAPDAELGREDRRAWSSATPDGQSEWIEVVYEQPVQAVAIAITESYNPGAIRSIKAFDDTGKWHWVLENRTARPVDKDSQVTMNSLSAEKPIAKLRITIESAAVPGYNQIDAVGLLDKKGQMHWASSATASSDRSQSKASDDPSHVFKSPADDSFIKAFEFLTQGAHAHVHVKNMNCQNCHQIQASDAADPRLQTFNHWIEAHTLDRPAVKSAASAATKDDASVKQDQQRQQRLTPLRKEIEEINQEIFKIKEELELQNQREASRAELERLRMQLEESRKAREAAKPTPRP